MPADFPPDVVAAVCRHMDDDHAAEALLICRTLGGVPDATGVAARDVDRTAISFVAATPHGERVVRVPFGRPVAERADLRHAVVELYERARSSASLSVELRARTAQAHARAESSPYLASLADGTVGVDGVIALLHRLLPVYSALERVAERWVADPVAGPFVQPELHRSARLRDDLRHLTGTTEVADSRAASSYSARIEGVAGRSAPAFVAHHYTRYLGDLSGGQLFRAGLERGLGLVDRAGASFLCFPGLRAGEVKRRYRGLLDTAPLDRSDREVLVQEALVAYQLNVALVAELDALDLRRSA